MRIAVWHDLPSGGGRRALIGHIEGLLERGHDIRVWSTPQVTGPLTLKTPRAESVQERVIAVPRSSFLDKLVGRLRQRPPATYVEMDRQAERVAGEMRQWRPDVLFAASSATLGTPPIGRHLPDLPSVLYLQEPYRRHHEAPVVADGAVCPADRPRAESLRRRVGQVREGDRVRRLIDEERRSARAFDLLLVNSIFSQESVLRALGCSSRVCYLGVDERIFSPTAGERDGTLVTVGEFAVHKGPRFLIESLGRMKRPAPLTWVANGVNQALFEEVSGRASELGVDLRLRSQVTDEELVRLLSRAQVLVYAPTLEPFGFAPLEAALCQTPSVAVALGGPRETIVPGETGLLVERDVDAFAAAVEAMLADAALTEAMGRRAREHCLRIFSIKASLDRLEKALVEAAGAVS